MIRRLVTLGAVLTVSVVTPLAIPGSSPVDAATSGATPTGTTAVQQQSNGDYISTYTGASGDVTEVYTDTPVTFTVTPETTSPITVGGQQETLHTAGLSMQPSTQAPPNGGVVNTPGAGAGAGTGTSTTPTAYDELVAMGVDTTTASQYQGLESGGGGSTATPGGGTATPGAGSGATTGATSAATAGATQYGGPICISQKFDPYNGTPPKGQPQYKGNVAGCDITYVDEKTSKAWLESDKFVSTGTMHDPTCNLNCDHVTGLRFGVTWPSGNTIENWRPNTTFQEGSCTTLTTGLSYGGASISESSTECPETFGFYSGGAGRDYSSKWDGQGGGPSNGSRSDVGVTAVYSPLADKHKGAPYDYYWWTSS